MEGEDGGCWGGVMRCFFVLGVPSVSVVCFLSFGFCFGRSFWFLLFWLIVLGFFSLWSFCFFSCFFFFLFFFVSY